MSVETKPCSFCKNEVNANAIICPNCGYHFDVPKDDDRETEYLVSVQQLPVPYRWLMFAACVVVIVGSLLPWGKLSTPALEIIVKGSDGDGVLTAGIGIVLLIVASLPDKRSKDRRLAMIAGGAFSVLLLVPKLADLLGGNKFETQVYPGIFLAVLGAICMVVSGAITRNKDVPL